jgi:hypothetical protein
MSGRVLYYGGDVVVAGQIAEVPGYGSSVVLGDFNGDGEPDRAVGAVGSVEVIYSATLGPEVHLPPDEQAALGQFGRELRALDADGDEFSDLLVAAPGSPSSPAARYYLYLGSDNGLWPAPRFLMQPE